MEKVCTICQVSKSLDAFHNARKGKYGKAASCRTCYQAKYNTDTAREQRREHKRSNIATNLWRTAKARAERDKLPFDIQVDDIEIPEFCPVFGMKLEMGIGVSCASSPTLDKIVPELGYVRGNIQVISFKANTMKSNATHDELVIFANWILKHS